MNKQIHIEDFDIVSDMVDAAARKIWSKSYKMCWHVFGEFEDTTQVGWAAICGKKSAREIVAKSAEGNHGLILTIAYRGMLDYVRSVVGRENAENCDRKLQLFRTTRYMDYCLKSNSRGKITNHNDMLDYIMPMETKTPESILIASSLQQEIDAFLNKKLNRKDKMIMDYIFKNDIGQREIGKKFKITESRVSQIKAKAIKHAKAKFADI